MEGSTDLFINLIQNHRILYDKSLKDFKNVRKKEEAWKSVAAASRMTVDSAKKRYFSLRQKYCREKKNIEVRRRFKLQPKKLWIYHERLHFLDSFITARSTYTNDTLFDEDDDEQMHGNGVTDNDEQMDENGAASKDLDELKGSNIDIQVEDDIGVDELNNIIGDSEGIEPERHSNHQIIELGQNHQNDLNVNKSIDNANGDVESTVTEYVFSDYTGEMSTLIYIPPNDYNDDSSERHPHSEEINAMDTDGFMSPHPHTSSSCQRNQSSVRNSSTVGNKTTSAVKRLEITKQLEPNNPRANASTTQQQRSSRIESSNPRKTAPKNYVDRQDQSNRVNSSVNGPSRETRPLIRTNAMPTDTSKEKRIEEIRHRMESCLSAITKKMTEKTNRSPHAPFLAYLGTRLPNVPAEILPGLERKILDLVDANSK